MKDKLKRRDAWAQGLCFLIVGAIVLFQTVARADAHAAKVGCDPDTGGWVVEPDYLHLNPGIGYTGEGTVIVSWADGFKLTLPLPASCPPPPFQGPPPAPTPEVPEVAPAPPLTCAELLARYPGAGKVRRAAWGCPVPVVKLPPKPDRPKVKRSRVVTCGWVLAHYRGAARNRMVRKHGLPRTCGRPFAPAVAG